MSKEKCKYTLDYLEVDELICGYYTKIKRKDGKSWNHFPTCCDNDCPIKHPELLEGEEPLKED